MRRTFAPAFAVTICLLTLQQASAADLYRPPASRSLKDEPVYAEPALRTYLALRGGFSFLNDTKFDTLGTGVSSAYKTGGDISGAAGMYLGNAVGLRGLRGELELGHTSAAIKSHDIAAVGKFNDDTAFGRAAMTYGLASLYYDFDTGSSIRPFVGAGGGLANLKLKDQGVNALGTVMNNDANVYAYHLTAGLNFQISKGLELEASYRYLATAKAELTAVDGTRSNTDIRDNQLRIGIRQSF
jgi:opacity protein-like surface antigen